MQKSSSMPGLKSSLSVPGLMTLGCFPPKGEAHHRKTTLGYKHNSSVDFHRHTLHKDDEDQGDKLATMMMKPGWRLDATERPATPTMVEDVVPKNMRHPRVTPAWLKHDKQVLRFYGFCQETVTERADENARYRTIAIMYYMEDGTLEMSEPRVENSGIPQGAYLKRHRVPRADGNGFLGPDDFRCGIEITIYGRTYHITGCDRFTRWFYEENAIDVGEDEPVVQDRWQTQYRFNKTAEKGGLPVSRSCVDAKTLVKFMVGQPPATKINQFLLNDGKVLRFKAYWDDDTLYGARVYFTIHFFLSDNSVEINEAPARNSGRQTFPVFYRRGPLYRTNNCLALPAMLEPEKVPYMPEDFVVGEAINVWGRHVVLYDCDDFTEKFYRDYMDVDQTKGKIDVSMPPIRHVKLPLPPHNGIGSEEDSALNCVMIQPKPPKQDLVRLMTLSGEELRFEAKMMNGEPEDETRKFVISYYPADHRCMVCETVVRNSGHMAGKFKKKERTVNPATGRYFEMTDFFIGATVTFASQPMQITRADEHCLQYLETNCHEYPKADLRLIASKLLPIKDSIASPRGIDPDDLKDAALSNGIDIVDHEIVTLLRKYPTESASGRPAISCLDAFRDIGRA